MSVVAQLPSHHGETAELFVRGAAKLLLGVKVDFALIQIAQSPRIRVDRSDVVHL